MNETLSDTNKIVSHDPDIFNTVRPMTVTEIELPYVGIPVLTDIYAVFDPVSERVDVMWDAVQYDALNDYVVYRDSSSAPERSELPVGNTLSNSFTDPLTDLRSNVERILELKYRVAVRDTNRTIGETFGFALVTVKLSPLPEVME